MRTFASFVLLLIALAAMPASAAGPRIALVIGNDDYHGGLGPLDNAEKDVVLITGALINAGFEVDPVPNARGKALSAAIARLTSRLKQAGPGAVGLFYFAGHGLQYQGTNYLLPIDATVEDPADISRTGLDMVNVLWAIQDGGALTSIVILDACRRDHVSETLQPVAEDGLTQPNTKGLDKKRNVLIVYSTGLGETAADGDKAVGNSPFAIVLAENMRVPNQGIVDTFINVSSQMVDGFDQKPWLDLGWTGREKFSFVSEP